MALGLIPHILNRREANIREDPDLSAVERRQAIAAVRIELRNEQQRCFARLDELVAQVADK